MKAETTLTFTGDIGFDKYMKDKWQDASLLDGKIVSFLHNSDHVITNVEGPLYSKEQTGDGSAAAALTHSMDPGVRHFLSRIGSDIWNICNNHIMDAGYEGIASTIEYARECKATPLGAGMNISEASAPVILDEAGGIGLIGVGYQRACRKADTDTPGCFSWSDLDLIREKINAIKQSNRWCIVVSHAGEEFTALPSPYTRERYFRYLDMGADIVVAHHPHVVNNYELTGGKAIFYSLGNFIFDTDYQRSQFGTEYGIVLKLHLNENDFSFEPLPVKVDRTTEKIVCCDPLPIFTDVPAAEYEKLKSLAAAVLIANTKRQLQYMRPDDFSKASEEDFVKNFYEPLRSGRVPGETLDMQIIYPLSLKAEEGLWKTSALTGVVEYMQAQLR